MGCYSKFARCSAVVVEVFPKIMQELLATLIKSDDLYNRVTNHEHFKNRLSGDEMIEIQTLLTDGFSKLNVTLIYKIVKFFNFTLLRTRKWGEVPLKNEIEIGDDVKRIRFAKQHLSQRIGCDMQDLEFQTFFNDVEQLCMRVDNHLRKSTDSGFQIDIVHFKTYPITDCQEIEYIAAIKGQEFVKGMDLQELSVESVHLSALLNACGFQLPLVNLRKNMASNFSLMFNILRPQAKILPFFIVGGAAEGLNTKYKENRSDVDAIIYPCMINVIEHGFIENMDYDMRVLRLPDSGHPGYSKLKVSKSFRYPRNHLKFFRNFAYLKNTIKKDFLESSDNISPYLSYHGPAITAKSVPDEVPTALTGICERDFDIVFCLRGVNWPDEASEWITRKRISNWPTKELHENIINSGYFLAGVGSRESKDHGASELQWRVSFNKAEELIIESFNETQIHCIIFLKCFKSIYLSNTAGKNITSFTMKNLMFWCLEEIPTDHWQSSKLLWCICFCIIKLKSFVEKVFFPSYFIRDRNLFISGEFTCVIQTQILQRLECFLKDPNSFISLLCSDYKIVRNSRPSELIQTSQTCFVREWFICRVDMLDKFHCYVRNIVGDLYEGYNINDNIRRCQDAIDKLKSIYYTQPTILVLQNCMGVLQYILQKDEDEIRGETNNADTRRTTCSKYLSVGETGDLTHTSLRIATCYLDDGVKEDCLNIIRSKTNQSYLFMQDHVQYNHQNILNAFSEIPPEYENHKKIAMCTRIIKDIDLIDQDPYKTKEEFELLNGEGTNEWYSTFINSLKQCWFDVTFMQAEIRVLPKPAALELCSDNRLKKVSFHPFLYGLLLEFLWHEKNGSTNNRREAVLRNMKTCVTEIPDGQKSKGLNFIAYCCSLQKDYRAASRYLLRSFKLNPVEQNVAYLYIKYILTLLRLTLSNDNDDSRL